MYANVRVLVYVASALVIRNVTGPGPSPFAGDMQMMLDAERLRPPVA
jgi:hypothetical protein